MLEYDELGALLNGNDWDQPLSPLDLNLLTGPDIITLLSSASSPISPVDLPDQPPNPLVEKFRQSLTNTPIQFTDHPATSRREPRVNILLPSMFGSTAHSNNSQRNHDLIPLLQDVSPLIRRLRKHLLKTPEHLVRDLIDSKEISKFPNRSGKTVFTSTTNLFEGPDTTPIYTTSYLKHFNLGNSYFGIIKDKSRQFRTLPYHPRDLWYP